MADLDSDLDESEDTAAEAQHRRAGRRRPSALALTGLVVLLAVVVLVGWVCWQYFGTGVVARYRFDHEITQVRHSWSAGGTPTDGSAGIAAAAPGTVVGVLRVPAWGDAYEVPLVKGVTDEDLARGVGMYPSSVAPGQIGNFAVAGHRVTNGSAFDRLAQLSKGARIVIETRAATFTYVLDNAPADLTVADDADWVLDQVPGHPQERPTRALITLTTAQDLFRSPDRTVGFGHLVGTVTK